MKPRYIVYCPVCTKTTPIGMLGEMTLTEASRYAAQHARDTDNIHVAKVYSIMIVPPSEWPTA